MELIVLLIIVYSIVYYIYDKVFRNRVTYINQEGNKVTENLQRRQPRQILQIEKPDIEITVEIEDILNNFENTRNNIFLTGKAGTGKSTLLRYFRATTNKNFAVVAPTGVAAINVQGQTIHSFFGFGIDITPDRVKFIRADKLNLVRNLETLIIDEISMVRADLLDCIDVSLRKNRRINRPFGGVQIIAIGDPYQLPPIVKSSEEKFFSTVYDSPHFFSAKSYREGGFKKFELTKIYRQSDPTFINILNNVRAGHATEIDIEQINNLTQSQPNEGAINLVTTNAIARSINTREMLKLQSESKEYEGHITGDFKESLIPTEMKLVLKEGARVMLLNNDKRGRWVNGDVGTIIALNDTSVRVKFEDNTFDDVDINEWDNVKFVFDEEEKKIVPEIVGKFIQLPIKLAWAVTIHKSQGKTYDYVHIDFGMGTFAPGQAYVALSRCTSLNGLTFEVPMNIRDIITDEYVTKFMKSNTTTKPKIQNHLDKNKGLDTQRNISKSDINKLHSFINSPEKYATGTVKAKDKVKYAGQTYKLIESDLDTKSKERFYHAMERYNKKLGKS